MNVSEFEKQTSYCPLYLAWRVVDEARNYFRTDQLVPSPAGGPLSHRMGEGLADKLARRAETVLAKHPFWRRKYKSANGGSHILSSMRHWLAGVLAKENPVLFRQLPESFKIGLPLPEKRAGGAAAPPCRKPKTAGLTCRSAAIAHGSRGGLPHHRCVHGCELLAV